MCAVSSQETDELHALRLNIARYVNKFGNADTWFKRNNIKMFLWIEKKSTFVLDCSSLLHKHGFHCCVLVLRGCIWERYRAPPTVLLCKL